MDFGILKLSIHEDDLCLPQPCEVYEVEVDDGEDSTMENATELSVSQDPHFLRQSESSKWQSLTQSELNDLIRDLDMPKDKAEALGSRLKQWNLQWPDVRVTIYWDRQKDLTHILKRIITLMRVVMLMV